MHPDVSSERVYRLNCQASDAYCDGDFRTALNRAKAALKNSRAPADQVVSLLNLVECLHRTDPCKDTRSLARRALTLCQLSRDPALWEEEPRAWRALGSCLQQQDELEEALYCREQGVSLERELLGGPSQGSLLQLGDNLYDLARYPEALQVYDEVERMGVTPERASTLATNRAAVFSALGRYAEALELDRMALRLEEEQVGPDHYDVVSCLENLAVALGRGQQHQQALPLLQRARRILERCFGRSHAGLARTLKLLAHCQEELGQESLSLRRQALTLCCPGSCEQSHHEEGLACVLGDLGENQEAEALFQSSLARYQALLGADHPYTLHVQVNLAGHYRLLGRLEEAGDLLAQVQARMDSGCADEIYLRINLAWLEGKRRDYQRAWEHIQVAHDLLQRYPESSHSELVGVLREAIRHKLDR